MRDTTLAWTRRWVPGQRFAMMDTTQAITLDIIIEAVFGVTGGERVRRFHDVIVATIATFSPLIVMFKFLRHDFLGLGPWAKFQRHFTALRRLVDEELVALRAAPEGREDILSMLVLARYEDGRGLTDQEIFDQLLTLLMAGHETTSIALAWALYFLHQNPQTLTRLRAELATLGEDPEPEATAKLPYLEAVCSECLRLRPLPVVSRKLARPLTVLGYELPAGMLVGSAAYATHMREDIYPEPEQFRPERFLSRTYSPFEYLPFGGGARRCIGSAFALYEMKLVLATLLTHNRLELVETGPVKSVMRAATVGPKGGIAMILKERLG
jgi:cytochrome P450